MTSQGKKVGFRVLLDQQDHIKFKTLAVHRQIPMGTFIAELTAAAVKYYALTGRYLDEDINRPSRIQDFLVGVDLVELAKEILLPIENLQAIVAGERPSDEDLIALSAAPCVTIDIEELHDMRDRQFDRNNHNGKLKKQPNGVCSHD